MVISVKLTVSIPPFPYFQFLFIRQIILCENQLVLYEITFRWKENYGSLTAIVRGSPNEQLVPPGV